MGIIMCSPEISSAINSFITPYLYTKSESISVPLFVGVGVCFFSFLCGLLLIGIDQYAEKYDK